MTSPLNRNEISENTVILNRLRQRSLPGIGIPDHAILPDYDGFSILVVPRLVLSQFGCRALPVPDAVNQRLGHAKETDRVLLLILDGVGYLKLQEMIAKHPSMWLSQAARSGSGTTVPLTSVFPSTTANAVTSFATGLAPQRHGMLGYRLYLRETGTITNMIQLSVLGNGHGESAVGAGLDIGTFLGVPTAYEQLGSGGVDTHVVISRHIASSGLSSLLYRGATTQIHPVITFSDLTITARRILDAASGRTFVSAYWGSPDATAHVYGPDSDAYEAELLSLDATLAREWGDLPPDVSVMITSDHGMVSMSREDYLPIATFPDLQNALLLPPVGEPRANYVHLRNRSAGLSDAIRDRIETAGLTCIPSHEAAEAGLFGADGSVRSETLDRIGDFIITSVGRTALYHPYPDARMLGGMHGGLTDREMIVPLIVTRSREDRKS